jgi:hypothetical protein
MDAISRRRFLAGLGSILALFSLAPICLAKRDEAAHLIPRTTWATTQSFQQMGSSYTFAQLSGGC